MDNEDFLGLVGTTVADKYAIESVVGEGGFAIVYRAQHLVWKRPAAVKVFKALSDVPAAKRQELLDDFIQEGALLAELSEQSAAILQARDIGTLEAKGQELPYMVLEWLEGISLEESLEEDRRLGRPLRNVLQAFELLQPALDALSLAHGRGIAHRDVKPDNIFCVGDPWSPSVKVKLLDFGIAKVVQDAQKMAGSFKKTSGVMTSFTPLYGAPEQFNRRYGATGPWTDVYAFALMLVEVITGQPALEGDDVVSLGFATANPNERPTPRSKGLDVGDEVEAVFAKALAVSPDDRFQEGHAFCVALMSALDMAPSSSFGAARRTSRPSTGNTDPLAATVMPHTTSSGGAASAAITQEPGQKGGAPVGLIIGGVVGVAALAAGAFFMLGGKEKDRTKPPAPATSKPAAPPVSASASAKKPAGCPAGMVSIPGGQFFMGSDEDRPEDKPAHNVKLAPYCIDKTEVTVEAYKACSDKGMCKRASKVNSWPKITPAQKGLFDPLCNFNDPKGKGKHPINCVDWARANDYCSAVGKRLPTEAEWEFAARGPDGRRYPWGDDAPTTTHVNACGTECVAWGIKQNYAAIAGFPLSAMYKGDDKYPNTAPVGAFPKGASRYGVQDVVGNVWEWVADYHAPYEKKKLVENPKGPAKGEKRVLRGGAWNGTMVDWLRPTRRYAAPPEIVSYGNGFRCAKSL